MRAVLRVAVGNDIPPVKGFALRESGGMREGGGQGDRAGKVIRENDHAVEFKEFELEFYKYYS